MFCKHCIELAERDPSKTPRLAERRLWCPTWVNAHNGPMPVCAEHAKVFDPQQNENASNGDFFWNDDADNAFASVAEFITRNDREAYDAARMRIESASDRIMGDRIGVLSRIVAIVGGQLWVAHHFYCINLGEAKAAQERYPNTCKAKR